MVTSVSWTFMRVQCVASISFPKVLAVIYHIQRIVIELSVFTCKGLYTSSVHNDESIKFSIPCLES